MSQPAKTDETTANDEWINVSDLEDDEPTPIGYRVNCDDCGDLEKFEDALVAVDAAANHFARHGPGHDTCIVNIYGEPDDAGR